MTICDRESLIMWCEGLLLDFKNGRGRACNELQAQAAEEALGRGETVLLYSDNKIVSQCRLAGDRIVEEPYRERHEDQGN